MAPKYPPTTIEFQIHMFKIISSPFTADDGLIRTSAQAYTNKITGPNLQSPKKHKIVKLLKAKRCKPSTTRNKILEVGTSTTLDKSLHII